MVVRSQRGRIKRNFARTSVASTRILVVLAIVVVGLVAYDLMRESPSTPPVGQTVDKFKAREPGSPPKPALFVDVTATSGLTFEHINGAQGNYFLPELLGAGAAFLDFDQDGDLDVYCVQSGELGDGPASHHNQLFENNGNGRFEDVTDKSRSGVTGYGMGVAAADYDNDGDVDLFITRLGANVMLRNNADGTFTDSSNEVGVGDDRFGASAAFLDFDRDGWLDLYVVNYVDWRASRESTCFNAHGARDYCGPTEYDAPATDVLYHNLGNGRFEDVSSSSGIDSARGNGLGVLCTDFTGDGWIDIFVANDQTPEFLWVNQADGTFREEGALRGCAFSGDGIAIAGMGVVAEDVDADGDSDLYVTNIFGQGHLILRNDGGYFEDVGSNYGENRWDVLFTGFGIAAFDADHDGGFDGWIANGAVLRLAEPWRSEQPYAEPNHFFRIDYRLASRDASNEVRAALGVPRVSRATVVGDYDNDGDLDVLITNNGGPAQLLRNDHAPTRAWAMFDLTASGGPRHALNARIEVEAAGAKYRREVRPHVGYLGSNDPRVHVGLGDAKSIDRVTIGWPDGTVESWTGLPVNRHWRIRQGAPPQPITRESNDG